MSDDPSEYMPPPEHGAFDLAAWERAREAAELAIWRAVRVEDAPSPVEAASALAARGVRR